MSCLVERKQKSSKNSSLSINTANVPAWTYWAPWRHCGLQLACSTGWLCVKVVFRYNKWGKGVQRGPYGSRNGTKRHLSLSFHGEMGMNMTRVIHTTPLLMTLDYFLQLGHLALQASWDVTLTSSPWVRCPTAFCVWMGSSSLQFSSFGQTTSSHRAVSSPPRVVRPDINTQTNLQVARVAHGPYGSKLWKGWLS